MNVSIPSIIWGKISVVNVDQITFCGPGTRAMLFTRCIRKFLRFFLRDDLTEQHIAYEFEPMSVCLSDINLQNKQKLNLPNNIVR